MEEKKKVLVIEDNPHTRFLVNAILQSVGCAVIEAEDGQKALDKISDSSVMEGVNAIFLDILMPHVNGLEILQKLKGDVLQQFLDLTAARGGYPMAGLTMQIKDKKAVNVMIGGKPLDINATYTTVNSDFIANGGDNADMLRTIPQITNGYLMRDAIFDYIKKLKSQGKNISANIENRVTNAQ